MKKLILLLFIQFTLIKLNAQVKIGAPGNPDVNAVLELAGTTKGLLLPRVALTGTANATPLSAHTAGMVVYNTATIADVTPGYFYNDGTRWNRLAYSSETWGLNGNSATNPASQFLGTSDSTDFAIKTDNLERIRISSTGVFNIGTNSLPANMRIRIGGSASGSSAASMGLNGNINSTADGQTLYSFYNNPIFSPNFTAANIFGASTEMSFGGRTTGYLVGDNASLTTTGFGSFMGINAGMRGRILRNSIGSVDGTFFGGQFSADMTDPSAGILGGMYAISGTTTYGGSAITIINDVGAQLNSLNITHTNPNSTIGNAYGIRNTVSLSAPITLFNITGIFNAISASSNGIFTTAYGHFTRMSTTTGGQIVNAFANYLEPIVATANITNYRGIFVGNIGLTSGTRRVFEYDGTGTNDPVIINYDGSVQIGNPVPVTNAKLSITDGHLQTGQTTKPTIVGTASMGIGGLALLIDATDVAGIIQLGMGTGAYGSGAMATITFNKVYATAPIVIITPVNFASATGMVNQRPFISTNTTSFTIHFAIAPTLSNNMLFNYHVIETINN